MRCLALFVVTSGTAGNYRSGYASDIVFLSLISFCLLCMKNIRRNDCARALMFTLWRTWNKNISPRPARHIHEIVPLKWVCFRTIITTTQTKIFSIKVREESEAIFFFSLPTASRSSAAISLNSNCNIYCHIRFLL